MTTQNSKYRSNGPCDRRLRIVINDNTEAPARRLIESSWKEEARAMLTKESTDDRVSPSIVADIEMVSTLRQPRTWDVRSEPRVVTLVPREEIEETAAPATPSTPARRVSGRRQWEWWQVVAPAAITLGAIWQLIWAVR